MRCINLAYKDMMSAGRFYLNINKETFIKEYLKILEKNNFQNPRTIIQSSLLLFGKNNTIGNNNKFVSRYGLCQKLVNMTFKYLYVFRDYTHLEDLDFSKCDCPLDSFILKKIKGSVIGLQQLMHYIIGF